MKDNTETKKLYKKFFLKSIPLYVLMAIICLLSICFFGVYAEFNRDDKNMDTSNVIQADVTSISRIPQGTSPGYTNNWDINYEYNDGNFLYKGGITVSGRETAEGYLGGTIDIYIDGKGHSVAVSEYNWRQESGATKRALIIGIVCLICFSILTGLSVLLFLRKRKKIKSL